MIRAAFHIDPHALTPEEWAQRFAEAVWVENKRTDALARRLGALFAPEEG